MRIGGALALGAIIVAGAFFLQSPAGDQNGANVSAVVWGDGKTYIRSTDSDRDGMSDWEEELRDMTLRATPDAETYVGPTNESVGEPTTLTERFSRAFFEQYVRSDASGMLTTENKGKFLDASIATLEDSSRDTLLNRNDITIGDDTETTLRAYGNSLTEIIDRHSFETENEITILERAVQSDSEEELKKLTNIANAYDAILTDTLTVSAPEGLVNEHLALVNAYQAIRNDIEAMEQSFVDPLYAMIRVKRYTDDVSALHQSLKRIYARIDAEGIVYADDEWGKAGEWYVHN